MRLRCQGADPNQWLNESPDGSRLPASTVSAAGRPTRDRCGMGLTPVLGSSGTYRLPVAPSPLAATGGVR